MIQSIRQHEKNNATKKDVSFERNAFMPRRMFRIALYFTCTHTCISIAFVCGQMFSLPTCIPKPKPFPKQFTNVQEFRSHQHEVFLRSKNWIQKTKNYEKLYDKVLSSIMGIETYLQGRIMEPILSPVQQNILVQLCTTMICMFLSCSILLIHSNWLKRETSRHLGPNHGIILSSMMK